MVKSDYFSLNSFKLEKNIGLHFEMAALLNYKINLLKFDTNISF